MCGIGIVFPEQRHFVKKKEIGQPPYRQRQGNVKPGVMKITITRT